MAEISNKFTKLETDLAITKNVNSKLQGKIFYLEKQNTEIQQYSRRECLDVFGIPDNVGDDVLEAKVLDLFKEIGCVIDKKNVEACHRVTGKEKPSRTIIKLSRRKDVFEVLKNKNKLKGKQLSNIDINNQVYINESLCRYNKYLWIKCKQLWLNKVLHSFWFGNGALKIRLNSESKPIRIGHIQDLKKLFPASNCLDDNEALQI